MNTTGRWLIPRVVFTFLVLWANTTFATEEVTERAVPNAPLMQTVPAMPGGVPRTTVPGPSLDQTVAQLQQQVQALTAQVAALQSVLKVTPTGATLQAPTISLLSIDGTQIRSGKGIAIDAGTDINMRSSSSTSIRAASTASIEASATLDLKGAVTKLNGGTKPLATVGSLVQVPGSTSVPGQIITGSQTVLGN